MEIVAGISLCVLLSVAGVELGKRFEMTNWFGFSMLVLVFLSLAAALSHFPMATRLVAVATLCFSLSALFSNVYSLALHPAEYTRRRKAYRARHGLPEMTRAERWALRPSRGEFIELLQIGDGIKDCLSAISEAEQALREQAAKSSQATATSVRN